LIISKGAPVNPTGVIGPISGGAAIESAIAAIHEYLPIRQCKPKITEKSIKTAAPCILFEINKCGAPCIGNQSIASYNELIYNYQNLLENDFRVMHHFSNSKMTELSLAEKFEEAIEVRDRYSYLLRAAARIERLHSIAKIPELIVAKPLGDQWEFASIKYGRLAATNISTPTTSVSAAIETLEIIAEKVPNIGFLQQVNHEEVELILNYLESEGVRLVKVEGEYSFALFGPNSQAARISNYDFAIA
jgi:DNA polymerase-3 subunit epsilon